MTPIRRAPIALAAAALLLAGCSSTVEGTASPSPTDASSSSSSSSSSSASAPSSSGGADDLTAGLLPEDAFGAGATVSPVTEADVAAGSAAGSLEGATITPESCAQAVQKSQPSIEDLDGFAAQAASSGTTITVEVITQGAPGDPAADLASAVQLCPQATITSPEIGTATITFALLDVPDIGDGSAALTYTTTVTGPDGSQLAIPAQVGVAVDGDRAVTLLSTSVGGTLDPAAFAELLRQAYEYQADQLD